MRALGVLGATIGLGATFTAAVAVGVILHVNLAPARRIEATVVSRALANTFQGRLVVERIGRISLRGIAHTRVSVRDPEGRTVLVADGLRARVSPVPILTSVLSGKDVKVRLSEVGAEYVDALLVPASDGSPSVAHAFAPRRESTTPSAPAKRGLDLLLDGIELRHGWVHGQTAGQHVDVDIDGLHGQLHVTPRETQGDVSHVSFTARAPVPREARLEASGHVRVPAEGQGNSSFKARVAGTVGRVRVAMQGGLDGSHVHATLDVPTTDGPSVRDLVSEAPVYADLTLHAKADGTLPNVRSEVHATLGPGTVDVRGDVTLPERRAPLRMNAVVHARDVDLSTIAATGPISRLGATMHVKALVRDSGAIEGSYRVDVPRGTIAGQRVPRATAAGQFTRKGVKGDLTVDEPGLPTTAAFALHPEGRHTLLDFNVRSEASSLMRVARIPHVLQGSARVYADGRADLTSETVDAHVRAEGRELRRGAVSVDTASLRARVRGPMANPRIDAVLDVIRNGTALTAYADGVRVAGGTLDVPALVIEGLGGPVRAAVRRTASRTHVTAQGPDLDLERVARFVGPNEIVQRGHALLCADIDVGRRAARGALEIDVRNAHVWRVDNADARVEAKLEGRHVAAHATVIVPNALHADLDTKELVLGGAITAENSWRTASGGVSFDADVDLGKVQDAIPPEERPFDQLGGKLEIHALAHRANARETPTLVGSLRTVRLVASGIAQDETTPYGTLVPGPPPWRTEGLDVQARVTTEGPDRRTHLSVDFTDRFGRFLAANVEAKLPVRELMMPGANARAILESVPILAQVVVPWRALERMPAIVGRPLLEGDAQMSLEVRGTAAAAKVRLIAHGHDLRAPHDFETRPFDASVIAAYDGLQGTVDAVARRGEGALATAHGDVTLALKEVLRKGAAAPWTASGRAELHAFPLQSAAPLGDRQIKGELTGSVALERLHEQPHLFARFDANRLSIGTALFPHAFVTLAAADGMFEARLRLDQADGFGDARATAGVRWTTEMTPSLDTSHPLDVAFDAKNLRLAAVKPLLLGTLSELDGRLDAHVRARAELDAKKGDVSGQIVLSKGLIEIPAIGSELHDARATITMRPWGTLRFDDVSANGITGHLDAHGTAQLDGLRFVGAEAHVEIPRGKAMPLTIEGIEEGDAWGIVDARVGMSKDRERVDVNLDVPSFQLDLPQSTGHPVQSLEPDKTIRVGVPRPDGRFVLVPLEPPLKQRPEGATHVRIAVNLGNDVEIRRNHTLRLPITGSPIVDIAQTAHLSGAIVLLPGGEIEVQNRRFKIEKGTVTFTGQPPSNPIVVATAAYDAPDGTRIFADFAGPVKTGKVVLHSEPPHTQDEILALLLFGSPEGSFGTSQPPGRTEGAIATATSLGGAFVAQGINRALAGFTGVQIATRVDTGEAGNPRPELMVQISKNVAIQAAYNVGTPGPGQNPDRTLLMIDWRFVRQWLLETTIGDRGSSWVDVLWNFRY